MDMHILVRENKRGQKTFYNPNLSKVSRETFTIGDKVVLPVERSRRGFACLWESGCRSLSSVKMSNNRPYGLIIADRNDEIFDGIGFNRQQRGKKFIQALVPLPTSSFVYIGCLDIKRNSLALDIKVVKLIYRCEITLERYPGVALGEFEVVEIFNNYDEVATSVPAQRLVKKLYTSDVNRPYFTNPWGYLKGRQSTPIITKAANELIHNASQMYSDFEQFLDDIESSAATLAGEATDEPIVLQVFDFNVGQMSLTPVSYNSEASQYDVAGKTRIIKFNNFDYRYNHFLTIGKDVSNLRFLFTSSNAPNFKSHQSAPNVWCVLRTFKA